MKIGFIARVKVEETMYGGKDPGYISMIRKIFANENIHVYSSEIHYHFESNIIDIFLIKKRTVYELCTGSVVNITNDINISKAFFSSNFSYICEDIENNSIVFYDFSKKETDECMIKIKDLILNLIYSQQNLSIELI